MDLSNLTKPDGATRKRFRKGRGPGSGNGKTAGRGHKGQKSRSGGGVKPGFEGGQMPLQRRLPKRGFHNKFSKTWSIVNLEVLEEAFEDGAVIDAVVLAERRLIWSRHESVATGGKKLVTRPVKILGEGSLTKKLTIKAQKFSKSAEQAIVDAGGAIEVI